MSEKLPWIKECGTSDLEGAHALVSAFLKAHPSSRYICFHTDRFSAGADAAKDLLESLLEMRVFDSNAELRLFRTSTGAEFQYRGADDESLKANLKLLETTDSFLKDPAHYRHPVYQVMDIDTTAPAYRKSERNDNGCRILRTIGGGNYALPLKGDENTGIVINYLCYDPKTGVCRTADSRMAGFEVWKGGKADA